MTLPDERYSAIHNTQQFLVNLCDPRSTPRVPGAIRRQAANLLRHYPSKYYLDRLAEKSPDVIIQRIEPLTRMVMTYQQEKHDDDAS